MRATLRWAHADFRAHRGEALFVVLASAGIIASLLLVGALFSYAANPWQRIFNQSQGAHIWLHTRAGADMKALSGVDGIAALSGPYRTAATTVESRGARAGVTLRAAEALPPATGRPLVTARQLARPAGRRSPGRGRGRRLSCWRPRSRGRSGRSRATRCGSPDRTVPRTRCG